MLDLLIIIFIIMLLTMAIKYMTKHKSCSHNCTSCNGCAISKDKMMKYYYENRD